MTTTAGTSNPVVALLSNDDDLARIVASAVEIPWRFQRHFYTGGLLDFLQIAGVRLVIVDDELVSQSDRSWLLAQVRRNLANADLLYVAGTHSIENERRARGNGAQYYTAKPIDAGELIEVLKGFMNRSKSAVPIVPRPQPR